jgi:hypothetical protein
MAVVVLVNFDGQVEAAGSHEILLRLVNDDGSPVKFPDTDDAIAIKAALNVDVRAEATALDAPATGPFIVNVAPGLPLEPGQRYHWVAEVDGLSEQQADVAFVTRATTPRHAGGATDSVPESRTA